MKKIQDSIFNGIEEIGRISLFTWAIVKEGLRRGIPFGLFVDQMYLVGVRAVPITLVAGGFVGAIMAIQINLQLRDFGAQSFLGGLSTSTTIRDVGPTLIAFLLSGKVGAFTSAELGTMRVTEQVDAIRCLGTDPMRYLILPRLSAVVVSSFLLLLIGLVITVIGGMSIASLHLGVNSLNYVGNISKLVGSWSLSLGLIKSLFFGIIIASVSCFYGYHTTGGAEGVGRATKKTAVVTLVCIIIANFALSSTISIIYELLGVDIV